jgi:hypothetical protein
MPRDEVSIKPAIIVKIHDTGMVTYFKWKWRGGAASVSTYISQDSGVRLALIYFSTRIQSQLANETSHGS